MQQAARNNLGFLLAKASQRWNELLYDRFCQEGYSDVRPSYGSILIPLLEEDGLHMGELARRAHLSKQTMTTFIRQMETGGLVRREQDTQDRRAYRIYLTDRSRSFRPVAERVLQDLDAVVSASLSAEQLRVLKETLAILINLDRKMSIQAQGENQ